MYLILEPVNSNSRYVYSDRAYICISPPAGADRGILERGAYPPPPHVNADGAGKNENLFCNLQFENQSDK